MVAVVVVAVDYCVTCPAPALQATRPDSLVIK